MEILYENRRKDYQQNRIQLLKDIGIEVDSSRESIQENFNSYIIGKSGKSLRLEVTAENFF